MGHHVLGLSSFLSFPPPPFGSHFTLLSRIHTLFLHLLAWASATEVAGTTTHRRQIPAAPESTPPRQACHEIMSALCQADNSRLPPTITIRVELAPGKRGRENLSFRSRNMACMSDLGFISITRVKHPTRWSWTRGDPLKSSMGMGYIVKLLNSARQTAVSASTSDSIQAALVSGRLVSHITYLWTPSDATRNFHGRSAALDLKRLSLHGLVRVLLDVKHLSMFRAFFLFFFSSWGWLAGGHVPGAGRTQHPAGRHRGFDTSQWLGTRARSAMMANWTSRGGRRYRMVMVRVLVFF